MSLKPPTSPTSQGLPNVKDFGARGDGSFDDTAVFQSTASNNQALFAPPGTYILSSLTGLPHIYGVPGATIFKIQPGTSNPLLTLAAGSNISGITIQGNSTTAKGILGTAGAVVVENCALTGMGGTAQIQVGADSLVRGCSVTTSGALATNKGIRVSGDRVVVESCTVDLTGSTGAGVTCISSEPTASNLVVRGNRLTGAGGAGVALGNALAGTVTASHCIVANNVILSGQADGILLGIAEEDTGTDNVITGNTVQAISGGTGPARDVGIETQLARTTISGNTVNNVGGHGIWVGGENCAVHGNTVWHAGQAIAGHNTGITVIRSGITVIGNTITDVGNSSVNTCYGIAAVAGGGGKTNPLTGAIIAFNRITETRAGATRGMTHGVWTAETGATATNIIVAGNLPSGVITANYSLLGSASAGAGTITTYGAIT